MNLAVESGSEMGADFSGKKKLRILHVDDDAAFIAVAKQCLEEQYQFQVDTTSSAEEALKKLENSEYDAIISDYQMPEKNGLELLRALRQQGRDIPFILLTCKSKEEVAIEALNSGVEQYITKHGNAEATYEEVNRSILSAVNRRKTEKLLKESESRLRQITENMQDLLVLTDKNLIVTYVSSSYRRVLGYEPNEIIGKRIYDFVHPDDLAITMETAEKAFKDNSGGKIEARVRRADGSYTLLEGVGKALTDGNGQITGIVMSSRDITERKQMEETLQKSEERFRQVSDNAQEWIWELDSNGLYTYASSVVEKVLGYKPEEIVGKKHFYDLLHPEEREELKKAAFQVFAKKSPFCNFVNRNVHKNGYSVWLSTSGVPIVDKKGSLLGYRGVDTDITERNRTEQTLKESEEKYRKLFEEAMDAIFVADAETGILIDCNRTATELMGRTKSELIGMHQRFLHPEEENGPEFGRVFEQHRSDKEGQIIEDHIITKSGEVRDVTIKPSLIEVNGKRIVQGIFRDTTEQKKRIDKIGFQARLLNAVGQAVIATDINGNITYWNRAAEQLYGWSEAEARGGNIGEILLKDIVQEDAAGVLSHFNTEKSWTGETTLKRRDGDLVQVIIATAPIVNEKGELAGIVAVSTDVTEKKWMNEVLEDAVKKVAELNEKLRVVESLTIHDIRNKLAALNGRIFLLKKRVTDNIEASAQLKEMELASQQILRILEFERFYVQVGSEELQWIDVEKHLSEAASLFSDLKGAQLINDCHGLTVLADSLLRQLFYNLIDNTLKYGVTISKIKVHFQEEKDQLKLIYEDNGVGMPDEVRNKLFTEGYGKGTGFGLFLIKRIAEAYGWTIQETGKQGQGAQFTMTIPKIDKEGKKNYELK